MRVSLPAIGDGGEFRFSGQPMHDAQLHDMQLVIKGARDHGKAGARLLVQRPESKIVAIEIANQRLNSAQKEIMSRGIPRRENVIVDSPQSPDESIQNMGRRRNNVLLEPKISGGIGEGDTSVFDRLLKARKSLPRELKIARLA